MNKRLVKKKRPAKAGRGQTVRKASTRAAASRKTVSRQAAKPSISARAAKAPAATKKSAPAKVSSPTKVAAAALPMLPMSAVLKLSMTETIVSPDVAAITVAEVTALSPPARAHKFRVGQTVSYTSSPISRPGASGSYQVVRLLPSDGDDYQYRIKNPGEAFERVAKESQLELDR
jgi:hypothetical protein